MRQDKHSILPHTGIESIIEIDNRQEQNNSNNGIPEYTNTSYERNKEILVNKFQIN